MPENIEIKAKLANLKAIEERLADLDIHRSAVIHQLDIFFNVPNGRLKLRRFSDQTGELIHYERPDLKGPKTSRYKIYRTEDPEGLQQTLESAFGVVGEVNKVRDLYLTGQTRIHLDRVAGLGDFLELEVVMETSQPTEDGVAIAQMLMEKIGITHKDCLEEAYIDLILKKSPAG